MSISFRCLLLLAAAALAPDAAAQLANNDIVATLQVNKGVVMTSHGAEYVSAVSGQALSKGERVMIAQEGTATISYSNGCQRTLDTPGVYTVDGTCTVGGWSPVGTAIGVTAAAAAVYTVIHNGDNNNNPQPPVSR